MTPAMASADRYARSLYRHARPWLRSPILEIGVGFGTYTGFLLQHGPVVACDIDRNCLERAQEKFAGRPLTTAYVDLDDRASVRGLADHHARSVFASNVFEHIADDVGALAALRGAVEAGAHLAIIVPAHPRLYGYLDEQAGHFRRYTRRTLGNTLSRAGWTVERTCYINALGGLGWWVNHRFFAPRPLDAQSVNAQLVIYDRLLVPVAQLTDPVFRRLFGLSVVGIARRAD